jgi:hypothetical protein
MLLQQQVQSLVLKEVLQRQRYTSTKIHKHKDTQAQRNNISAEKNSIKM